MTVDSHGEPSLTIGTITTGLRRFWGLVIGLLFVGAVAGTAGARAHKTVFTAQGQLLVGKGDVSFQAIPGYALASQQLAGTYARLLSNATIVQQVDSALGAQRGAVKSLDASPIPDSAVIRVESTATTRAAAVAAADAVSKALKAAIDTVQGDQTTADALLKAYTDADAAAAAARTAETVAQADLARLTTTTSTASAAAVAGARDRLSTATAAADVATLKATVASTAYQSALSALHNSSAGLSITGPAAISGDDKSSTLQTYVLTCMAVAGLLGLALTTVLAHRSQRRWSPPSTPIAAQDIDGRAARTAVVAEASVPAVQPSPLAYEVTPTMLPIEGNALHEPSAPLVYNLPDPVQSFADQPPFHPS